MASTKATGNKMASTEVYITDGDHRVVEYIYGSGPYERYLSVEHYCTAGRSGSTKKGWVGAYYVTEHLTKPCYVCERVPPDGIQAVFIMMKWHKA